MEPRNTARAEASGVEAALRAAPTSTEIVSLIAAHLAAAGRDEAQLQAEWLVSHTAGVPRLELAARSRLPGLAGQEGRLAAAAVRLAAGEPLQYVLGDAEFCGRLFRTDRRALIPRPETEELVEHVLRRLAARPPGPAPVIVDVGTGSGCIAVTLALERPDAAVIATDVSADALALAGENAAALGARVDFRAGPLLAGCGPASLDAVVSNPPYVPTAQCDALPAEIRAHEPRLALDGGPDGLAVIRPLLAAAATALRPGGLLFLETAEDQGPAVAALLREHGFTDVATHRDLSGHERFAEGTWGR